MLSIAFSQLQDRGTELAHVTGERREAQRAGGLAVGRAGMGQRPGGLT